jgi:transcriptional regulator with XRE-family HTH domain
MDDPDNRLKAMGAFIRAQREMAELSLRQLAEVTQVSNPYLSQLERGLHEPSARVLHAIANALHVSAETLIGRASGIDPDPDEQTDELPTTEASIRSDPRLTDDQKRALLAVYRSYAQSDEAQRPG